MEARVAALGCVAAAVAALVAVPASASMLRVGDQTQTPDVVYAMSVSTTARGHCDLGISDSVGAFPTPLEVAPGAQLGEIVYRRKTRPEVVNVRAFHAVDAFGSPRGRSELLPTALSAYRGQNGTIAGWKTTFTIEPPPTYYLGVLTQWPRDPHCGIRDQSLVAYSVGALPGSPLP